VRTRRTKDARHPRTRTHTHTHTHTQPHRETHAKGESRDSRDRLGRSNDTESSSASSNLSLVSHPPDSTATALVYEQFVVCSSERRHIRPLLEEVSVGLEARLARIPFAERDGPDRVDVRGDSLAIGVGLALDQPGKAGRRAKVARTGGREPRLETGGDAGPSRRISKRNINGNGAP